MGLRATVTTTATALALAALASSPESGAAVTAGPPPGHAATDANAPLDYRPPVLAAVIDGFRPPGAPFGPGNRGLEYDTEPGTSVTAIERGTVIFAGPVAGTRAVTVMHPDGLRSSSTGLASVAVAIGQAVERGEAIGTSGDRLHLGVRAGTAYLDPATLFATGARAHLVPVHSGAGPTTVGP